MSRYSALLEIVRSLTHERDTVVSDRAAALAPFDRRLVEIDEQMIVACREVAGMGSAPDGDDEETISNESEMRGPAATTDHKLTKADQIVNMLTENALLDYGKAAMELHGEDTDVTRGRVSSTLSTLQKEGRIQRLGRNRWKVVAR